MKCKICENYLEENDNEIICNSCIQKGEIFSNAHEIGDSYKESTDINGFWRFCFDDEQIENIFLNAFKQLPQEKQNELIKGYCEYDMFYFVNWLVRKCK